MLSTEKIVEPASSNRQEITTRTRIPHPYCDWYRPPLYTNNLALLIAKRVFVIRITIDFLRRKLRRNTIKRFYNNAIKRFRYSSHNPRVVNDILPTLPRKIPLNTNNRIVLKYPEDSHSVTSFSLLRVTFHRRTHEPPSAFSKDSAADGSLRAGQI